MDLSLDDIKSIIESNKNTTRGGNSQRNEVKVGWLPEGTHKIRFFVDSERNMMRTYSSHKINGKRFMCPNFLRTLPPAVAKVHGIMNDEELAHLHSSVPTKCECCSLNREINNWKLGLGSKFSAMIYGHLIETSAPDAKWWVPGSVYAIITTGRKFKTAFDSMMESLAADSPEFLISAFNPQAKGGMFTVKYTRDKKNSEVSIQPVIGRMAEPVQLNEKNWVPLSQVYLHTNFNKPAYEESVEFAKKKQLEHAKHKLQQSQAGGDSGSSGDDSSTDKSSDDDGPGETLTMDQIKNDVALVKSEPAPEPAKAEVKVEAPAPSPAPTPEPKPVIEEKKIVFKSKDAGDPEDGCFGSFTDSEAECMTCDMNIECMTKRYS